MSTDHLPALSDRRQRFVHEYALDHNGTQAAIRAGYSPRGAHTTASRLLRDTTVRAAIDTYEQQIADELGVTKRWLVERMRDVITTALTPTPKTYQGGIVRTDCPHDGCDGCDADGKHVVMEVDGGVAHAALRTLMQHRGMLTEHRKVEMDGRVLYDIVGVNVDDLT